MKKLLLFLFFAAIAADAVADPCATILCMAGKVAGQAGGSSCNGPISDFFGINVFNRKGQFQPGNTAGARMGYMNSCPDPTNSTAAAKTAITNKFGYIQR